MYPYLLHYIYIVPLFCKRNQSLHNNLISFLKDGIIPMGWGESCAPGHLVTYGLICDLYEVGLNVCSLSLKGITLCVSTLASIFLRIRIWIQNQLRRRF